MPINDQKKEFWGKNVPIIKLNEQDWGYKYDGLPEIFDQKG